MGHNFPDQARTPERHSRARTQRNSHHQVLFNTTTAELQVRMTYFHSFFLNKAGVLTFLLKLCI